MHEGIDALRERLRPSRFSTPADHVERVSVGGGEGVYLADAAHQQLLWVVEGAEGSRIQYDLRTFHAAREWVWSIAECLTSEQ